MSLALFAITAPGLEHILSEELRQIGVTPGEITPGGVSFEGSMSQVRQVNLYSRVATRVIVRVDEFHANSFHELERRARKVPWKRFVNEGYPIRFRVTCRKSRLYHSDAVAERLAAAVDQQVGGNRLVTSRVQADEETPSPTEQTGEGPDAPPADGDAQLFIVRLEHDACMISADSSGEILHRRGYRRAVAKAPLRETMAAAMVMGSGWDAKSPLVDPLCGSGTIAIEAAMLARRIAPGISRGFAFERWPGHDEKAWRATVDQAREKALPATKSPILASDRDDGAVLAATANADRAGVGADLRIDRRAISDAELPPGRGWIVTNPPYGIRVGDTGPLRNLYAQLGKIVREKAAGYRLALLSADKSLESQLRLPMTEVFRSSNGGIPVRLIVGPAA